jgi:hypothetical protein
MTLVWLEGAAGPVAGLPVHEDDFWRGFPQSAVGVEDDRVDGAVDVGTAKKPSKR